MNLTHPHYPAYSSRVAALPATGFGDPNNQTAHKRPCSYAGAFFVPAILYGGCAWEPERVAGFRLARFANLRTATTFCLATPGGGLTSNGAFTMLKSFHGAIAPTIDRNQAKRHRALALAALRADSSLSVRLARYNHHVRIARSLEQKAENGVSK